MYICFSVDGFMCVCLRGMVSGLFVLQLMVSCHCFTAYGFMSVCFTVGSFMSDCFTVDGFMYVCFTVGGFRSVCFTV